MSEQQRYVSVPPAILFPSDARDFPIYTRHGEDFLLFCAAQEPYTPEHRRSLLEYGVQEVFIKTGTRNWLKQYSQAYLGQTLCDKTVSLELRSSAFYETSLSVVRDTFASKMPQALRPELVARIKDLVRQALTMLSREDTLRALGRLMTHDYETYSHSVNVFVLSAALLQTLERYSREDLIRFGVGAMLHDIGKVMVPATIINKQGRLNFQEFSQIKRHPVMGEQICRQANLEKETLEIILLHHEKLDGTGYPAGLRASRLPIHVRAVTITDIYDALTSKRPYAPPLSPFDALNLMREEFEGKIDPPLYEGFVKLLAGML